MGIRGKRTHANIYVFVLRTAENLRKQSEHEVFLKEHQNTKKEEISIITNEGGSLDSV